MVRLKIHFEVAKGSIFPLNYQYEISSWIYRVIGQSNNTFSTWLHEYGYNNNDDHKRYKLFSFSNLNIYPFKIDKTAQTIISEANRISLGISFYGNEAVEHFVIGLFQNQVFDLGNKQIKPVRMRVVNVEKLPNPRFSTTQRFSAKSPINISRQTEQNKTADYLHPYNDEGYKEILLNGIVHKYEAAAKHLKTLPDFPNLRSSLDWNCITPIEKINMKLITVKAFTTGQTRVKGYQYDFELTAPIEIQELVYFGGMGEKCSGGFGWVEILDKQK